MKKIMQLKKRIEKKVKKFKIQKIQNTGSYKTKSSYTGTSHQR